MFTTTCGLQLYQKRDSDAGVSCEFCEISRNTFLHRSFKVKDTRLINTLEPVPSMSTIDFQIPALLKILSTRTTFLRTPVGTAEHTRENIKF